MLASQYPKLELIGIDNDTVEEKNLARQLVFSSGDVGKSKGEALISKEYLRSNIDTRFSLGFDSQINSYTCVFCCADNLLCRQELLAWSDKHKVPCIITGNENLSAEAFIYLPAWKGRKNDPRKYYKELELNEENRVEPCDEAVGNQTIMANTAAATFAMYLFDLYKEINFNPREVGPRAYHFRINKSEVSCQRNKLKLIS